MTHQSGRRGWAAIDSASGEMVGYLCSKAPGSSITELHGTSDVVEAAMVSAWVRGLARRSVCCCLPPREGGG
jgi:hypothetical protein